MPKLVDGRPVIRLRGRGRVEATPYLREWLPKLPKPESRGSLVAIDLGCGTGRNSRHLLACDYCVYSYDMETEYVPALPWKAGQRLMQHGDKSVDLFLCQYVFMFLTDMEISIALDEIQRLVRPGGHVIIEIQAGVCASRPVNLDRVFGYLVGRGHWNREGTEWRAVHFTKEHCILERRCLI